MSKAPKRKKKLSEIEAHEKRLQRMVGEQMHGQEVKKVEGIKHPGTQEFTNRVLKRRKKAKSAKQARKKNRNKK